MDRNQLITVFTATYNRVQLLHTLYASLEAQTNLNFEWVIVDDGSIDNTTHLVKEMEKKAPFNITYYKQANQGKHIAINKGIALAKGFCFFIVDSDDRLPENSLAIIKSKFLTIRDNNSIAGVVGLKCYFDKKVVGSNPLKEDIICDIFDYRYKHKVIGDKAEVFKTNILKKYPFPSFNNEKFIPESIVWNRIGQHYKMLFFNENVYECEYLEEGLSNQSVFLRRKYPKGVIHLYAELGMIKRIGIVNRLKAYINYWRFYFCDLSSAYKNILLLRKQFVALLCFPLGMLFYLKDSFIQKNER